MNLLLINPDEFAQTASGSAREALISGERAEHIREVLQVQVGSRLRVGEIDGGVGEAEVLTIEKNRVRLVVGTLSNQTLDRPFELILATPRPQMLKRILEHSAACGIRKITLVGAARVQKSYFQSPLLSSELLKRHLHLGAEQGGLTVLPTVEIFKRFGAFMETLGRGNLLRSPVSLIADPAAANSLVDSISKISLPEADTVRFAIGPEGGWRSEELEAFSEREFIPFHLGKFVLRVETAVSAVWAQLSLLREVQTKCRVSPQQ